ncbi:sigma factor G inhibitor Gin [Anaerosalibacter sp. Marseille-P3206]|uniref:sigma factor G inhibitor Gin n=1 Tax=Anaerosalibacter sp. Marseille-P3206 TaxID=1871005 RepID=UPI0013565AAD|nr:sigma factor G inhibitor Gin [Anaerosalibacter sp. Marseille-P3206]
MFCSFCNQNKSEGVSFLNVELCNSCMEEITNITVEDDKYHYYIDIIKNIFKKCQLDN